ncbi:MAG: transcription antitermination factor NusB [Planctomycetota bacterium]|nr:transcription antitermination factor NusB [Planctomycetota bacterium]
MRTARELAHAVLLRQVLRFPDLLPTEVPDAGLDPREASLAAAICKVAVRHWRSIGAVLRGTLEQPIDRLAPPVRTLLLSGLAQMLFLDRVPVHAAIDETVELCKRVASPAASKLVNAVLRRVSRLMAEPFHQPGPWMGDDRTLPTSDGRMLVFTGPVLPPDAVRGLAAATSHAQELVDGWIQQFGLERAKELALHNMCEPPIVVNLAHASAETRAAWEAQSVPHRSNQHRVFTGERQTLTKLVQAHPDAWVQDASSSAAVTRVAEALRDYRTATIADACAGQGTKTRQLAALFPDAMIFASDADSDRLSALRKVFAGHARVRVVTLDELRQRSALAGHPGKFDLVLLDVPCSNTGVLARRPEAKLRADATQLARLVALQREILTWATPLAAQIAYSTCSLERGENEDQAAWACETLKLELMLEQREMVSGQPGQSPSEYADAAYLAILRPASATPRSLSLPEALPD